MTKTVLLTGAAFAALFLAPAAAQQGSSGAERDGPFADGVLTRAEAAQMAEMMFDGEDLDEDGYVSSDEREAAKAAMKERFDLVVADVMMPGEDGLSLTRWIRSNGALPVILLTARGDPTDKVIGLEIGADDYLAKPFEPRELLARIRSVLRRGGGTGAGEGSVYAFGPYVLHAEERRLVAKDGEEVVLTGGEFSMLVALLDAAPRVVSRDALLEATQGREAHAFDRAVDNRVSRLRRKIEADPKDPKLIKTHRGGGYALSAKVVRR